MSPPQSPRNGSQSTPWMSGSKSGAVQHAFVNARIADINRHALSKLFTPTLDALKIGDPSLRKASRQKLEDAFMHMQQRLQTSPLTINFMATKWFMTPNNYESYTQMYERAVTAGQMKLTDSPLNPAAIRVAADDRATFPKSAVDADFEVTGMGGRWKKYDLKATASPSVGRGLAPAGRGLGDAVTRMAPGALNKSATGDYTASNPQFDPRTKQVFAALDYGRRPHGACFDYGYSHLVLSDKFKRDALYFGGDTFGVMEGKAVTAEDQVSYDVLAAVYLKANPTLRRDLLTSCLRDGHLSDTKEKDLLLEAHLFEAVKFTSGATAMFVSGKDQLTQADGTKRPVTGAEWQTIQTNARTFASKHGLRVFFVE
jgi:hypothetical protein